MPNLQPERRSLGPAVSVGNPHRASDLLIDLAEAAGTALGEDVDAKADEEPQGLIRVTIEGWQAVKNWLTAASSDELQQAIEDGECLRPEIYELADAIADATVIQNAVEDWNEFTTSGNPDRIEFVIDLGQDA